MSKHTPGKWVAIDDWWFSSTSKDVVVVEEHGIQKLLCEFTHSAFREDNAANAKLIAAAPNLFDACMVGYQALKEIFNSADSGDTYNSVELQEAFLGDINSIWDALVLAGGDDHE